MRNGKDNFDGILEKIKENLDKVESVHMEKKIENYSKIFKGEMRKTDYGPDDPAQYDFIFSNKKHIFSNSSMSETIIVDDNIYLKFGFLGESSPWLLGKDGQSAPSFVPDSPGDTIDFNLTDYPEGWDFTNYAKGIEKDLGIEEINGVKCHHYKMNFKKSPGTYKSLKELDNYFFKLILDIDLAEFSMQGYEISQLQTNEKKNTKNKNILETTKIERKGNKIRYFDDNKEILIPIPNVELINLPFVYISVESGEFENKTACYLVETKGIEGEIWVGENDLFIYKEKYTVEDTRFYSYPNDSEEENINRGMLFYKNIYKIIYSDFNKDIKIEAPTKNVINIKDNYLEKIGVFYKSLVGQEISAQEKAQDPKQKNDAKRKADLSQIMLALEMYNSDFDKYPVSKGLEKINDANCVLYKILEPYLSKLPVDQKDPEYWYGYKSNGKTYELTARLENLEDESCVTQNGVCLYKCKDGKCGVK